MMVDIDLYCLGFLRKKVHLCFDVWTFKYYLNVLPRSWLLSFISVTASMYTLLFKCLKHLTEMFLTILFVLFRMYVQIFEMTKNKLCQYSCYFHNKTTIYNILK